MWNISSKGLRRLANAEVRGLSSDDGYPSAMTPSIVQDGGTPSVRTTSNWPVFLLVQSELELVRLGIAIQVQVLVGKWQNDASGGQVGLPSRKCVGVGRIIGGAIEPFELRRLGENDEVKTLAKTPRWRVSRYIQHSPEHVIRYRLLFKLPHHSAAAQRVAKLHARTLPAHSVAFDNRLPTLRPLASSPVIVFTAAVSF